MDVTLHLGAHRTATAALHGYVAANSAAVSGQNIAFWGPGHLRNGLLHGLHRRGASPIAKAQQARCTGRIGLRTTKVAHSGHELLVISDPDLMGTQTGCLKGRELYLGAGLRLARLDDAFSGRISRVFLTIRSQEHFWASLIANRILRGGTLPAAEVLDHLADTPRGWRDVITDLSCALPCARITVLPFEGIAGNPQTIWKLISGHDGPQGDPTLWPNRMPNRKQLHDALIERDATCNIAADGGRWTPFGVAHIASLRETYADDLYWLRSGADGLAELTEETTRDKTATQPSPAGMTRGQDNDPENGHMAPPG